MLYYILDLIVGFGFAPLILLLIRVGKLDAVYFRYFLIGASIGLAWEIPIFVMSAEGVGVPIIEWLLPLPLPYPIYMLCHTLWDGGLFCIGALLADRLTGTEWRTGWNARALVVMVGWGQLQALFVEVSSAFNGCWAYLPDYAWNPVLFTVNGLPITVMMQWVWGLASALFYGIVVASSRRPH